MASRIEAGSGKGGLGAHAAVLKTHLVPGWAFWLALVLLFAVNMAWVSVSPRLHLSERSLGLMVMTLAATASAVVYRGLRVRPADRGLAGLVDGLLLALFAALLTQQLNLFNHLSMSLALPLADARLHAWDEALGFDWNGYANWIAAHPAARAVMLVAYSHAVGPAIAIITAMALWRGRRERVEELAFLALGSCMICIGVAAFFPAEAAWNTISTPETRALLGGQPAIDWVEEFRALRAGGPVLLDFSSMQGLATFPSFHTCLALIIAWCSRGHWLGQWAGGLTGLAILAATPVYGAHYGVDVLAGTAVIAGLILLWRRTGAGLRS